MNDVPRGISIDRRQLLRVGAASVGAAGLGLGGFGGGLAECSGRCQAFILNILDKENGDCKSSNHASLPHAGDGGLKMLYLLAPRTFRQSFAPRVPSFLLIQPPLGRRTTCMSISWGGRFSESRHDRE